MFAMKYFSLCFLCLWAFYTSAQRHDNIWLYGRENQYATPTNDAGGYQFNFSTNPPTHGRARKPMDFTGFTMSMCDTVGNLQFYSNGLRIANRANQTMENGDSVGYSNGYAWNYFNRYNWGSDLNQCSVSIPLPGNDSVYYFFYDARITDSLVIGSALEFTNYLSIVDMRYNNGLGKVVEKDRLLMQDTFVRVSACKHANGRDWWVVIPHLAHHKAMVMLVTPDGIVEQRIVRIGNRTRNTRGIFNGFFSPDGERYALHTYNGFIRLFHFDRCSGTLSFERDIVVDSLYNECTIAFSPNSRVLYKFNIDYIEQMDLSSIQVGRDTVARASRVVNRNRAYSNGVLMPDGKIYVIPPGTDRETHIIHAPDSLGIACRVQTNAFFSPVYNNSSMPYFPNYRLGPLRGSGCDTLVSGVEEVPRDVGNTGRFGLYPNPASSYAMLTSSEPLDSECELLVLDMLGKPVLSVIVAKGSSLVDIDLSKLVPAVYSVVLKNQYKTLDTFKIVIIRE